MSAVPSVATSSRDPDAWDQAVEDSTGQFNYQDSTVRLLVRDVKFQVSRRLLITTSNVFADMFALPQGEESQEVVLHNDPEDFRYFLWFLHVDVLSMEKYNRSANQQTRFYRALGIATVAHMYSAKDVLDWAVAEVRRYLPNHRHDRELMTRAYHLASRIVEDPNLLKTVRREWIQGLQHLNVADMLAAARSVSDHGLLGCAYFVILQTKNNGWIADEPSLTPLDRARLMVGVLNLRHWEQARYSYSSPPTSTTEFRHSDSKIHGIPGLTSWDPEKLWILFTRSPFGLRFEHEADLSAHDDRPPQTTRPTK